MIQSLTGRTPKPCLKLASPEGFASIREVAERRLTQLAAAATLEFPKSPPGNHLELLTRDHEGQHSIRINKLWRVCFVWRPKVQKMSRLSITTDLFLPRRAP
jgi:toxin HigB-1